MATHAELTAAVQRLQQLSDSYARSLDAPMATTRPQVWVSPEDIVATELSARQAGVRAALNAAVADAERLLAASVR